MTNVANGNDVGAPLAGYAAYRRAGDLVYFAGIIAVDVVHHKVVSGYRDIPEDARAFAGFTGEMSSDETEGPIASQSWYVLDTLRRLVGELGGTLESVVNLTQYFVDLRDYPIYARIRNKFFTVPPASTCVQVSQLLPSRLARLEVQAVAQLPPLR